MPLPPPPTTYPQRRAAARESKRAPKEAAEVDRLRAALAELQRRFDDCNASRLYWRGRCRDLGAPELKG